MNTNNVSRRTMLRSGLLAGAGLFLAACQPTAKETPPEVEQEQPEGVTAQPPAPEVITINYWSWAEANFPHFLQMAENWNSEKTSGPKMKFEGILIPDSEQTIQKGMNAMAAGEGIPDVFPIEIGHISKFIKGEPSLAEQYLLDMVPGLDTFNGNWRDDYLGFAPYTWKGKVYGIEVGLCPTAYYYRADLFEEAGIEMPLVTWEDFVEAGEKMKEKGHAMVALDTTSVGEFIMDYYQTGGVLFDDKGELKLEDERAYKTLEMLIETAKSGVRWSTEAYWGAPHYAALNDGTVAGVVSAIWYSSFVLKPNAKDTAGKWRVQPMPTWKTSGPWGGPSYNTRNTSTWGGTSLAVPKQSLHPDLTFEFLAYSLLTEEGGKSVYKNMQQMPVVKSVIHDDSVTNVPDEFYGGQAANKVFADIADNIPPKFPGSYWSEAEQELNNIVAPAMAGEGTYEELIIAAVSRIKEVIAQS